MLDNNSTKINKNADLINEAKNVYRLEIFLSVDMVNSTALKASHPAWSLVLESFYINFTIGFYNQLKKHGSFLPDSYPVLWKSLGDELIFNATISSYENARILIDSFIKVVGTVREVLKNFDKSTKFLDLKSTAWVADFPYHNVNFNILNLLEKKKADEELENIKSLLKNEKEDFIGPSMDIGFRLGKFATPSKMMISIELAYILTRHQKADERLIFGYNERTDLKGVPGANGYPLIWLNTENDKELNKINDLESKLLGKPEIEETAIFNLCKAFIDKNAAFSPFLRDEKYSENNKLPQDFLSAYSDEQNNSAKEKSVYLADQDKSNDNSNSAPDSEGLESISANDFPKPEIK